MLHKKGANGMTGRILLSEGLNDIFIWDSDTIKVMQQHETHKVQHKASQASERSYQAESFCNHK
jgi:hypothetical protein